ncbi:MAG: hypothetical protein KatS3mg051_1585 [Anaerolineae bacterium]|nr:MAG: hypothetical protein KatS3mg051_1585 [Anaerolineae bacterium]
MKRVLSLDGGGSKGIITLGVLSVLEEKYGPLHRHYDLITGTSTGGIIAAGLGVGLSVQQIAELYYEELPRIFSNPRRFPQTLWRPVYRGTPLREALLRHLGLRRLGEVQTRVMLTSYVFSAGDGRPTFFKSWVPREAEIPLVDAVQATAQAPTQHPLHELRDAKYTDGGVFAKDPSLCAFAEARELWPQEPIALYSIGTGKDMPIGDIDTQAGLIQWGHKIAPVMLDGQGETTWYILSRIVREPDRAVRINAPVSLSSTETDEQRLRRAFEDARNWMITHGDALHGDDRRA